MTRVVHLSSAHSATDTRIFQKELQTLTDAGYECHYVVFDDGEDRNHDGVRIHPLGNRSRIERWRGMRLLYSKCVDLNADVYHFHDIELIPVGLLLKLRTHARIIYDAHENYPHLILKRDWIPDDARPVLKQTLPRLEGEAGSRFDHVVAATEWVEDSLRSRGVEKVTTIHNFPKVDHLPTPFTADSSSDCEYTLVYTGGLSRNRGIIQMIHLTAELRDRGWDVCLLCLGKFGDDETERETRGRIEDRRISEFVRFPGYVDYSQMFNYLAGADIGLALLDTHHYRGGIPTKLFEYMYAELPVAITNIQATEKYVSSDWAEIIDEHDVEAQATTVEELLENPERRRAMGQAGRAAVEDEFSWEAEKYKLLKIYEEVRQG